MFCTMKSQKKQGLIHRIKPPWVNQLLLYSFYRTGEIVFHQKNPKLTQDQSIETVPLDKKLAPISILLDLKANFRDKNVWLHSRNSVPGIDRNSSFRNKLFLNFYKTRTLRKGNNLHYH